MSRRQNLRSRNAQPWLGGAFAGAALAGTAWAVDAYRRRRQMRRMHRALVDALLNALTADDPATARHSRRVADLAYAMARCLGMHGRALRTLRVAALLHDMGKIDDRFFEVVHSRRRLTPAQRAEIKHHPHESAHILEPLERLHPGIREIVSSHHECWNGRGYPHRHAGERIPLAARIITVADVFDALTQPRPYHEPLPVDAVLDKLRQGAGTQFDPELVHLLLGEPMLLRQWREVAAAGLACERAEAPREEAERAEIAAQRA